MVRRTQDGRRYAWAICTEAWLVMEVMQTKGWVTLGWGCFRLRIKEWELATTKRTHQVWTRSLKGTMD